MKRMIQAASLYLTFAGSLLAAEYSDSPAGPRAPQDAAANFVLAEDCRIELVAAEPNVIDPVAMAFGADGRLWVVENTDYPNGPKDGEFGLSRVRILKDVDGDGRFDDAQVFADKLLFANGIQLWKDGALVTTDGKLIFLRDTNGDGAADENQIWFKGFEVENPQLRANHPTLAVDNLIYIANGLRGGNIVPGESNPWGLDPAGPPVSISGMDFRFDPLTGKHEAIAGCSQFGLAFDNWGNRYLVDNRHPVRQVILEDADLKLAPWLQPNQVYVDVAPSAEASRVYPLSRTWTTSNLHANQFTATCGTLIYRGNGLTSNYFGNNFVCEPTGNLLHREVLTPAPGYFTAVPQNTEKEFLATKDEWFRPVNLIEGPDGALYICDMYRCVIEHPQFMPEELQTRPDLTLGSDMGRLWRLTSKDAASYKESIASSPVQIETLSSAELVKLLAHPNRWQRETAQRLLLERQDQSIEGGLSEIIADQNSGQGATVALWTLNGLGLLKWEHVAAGLQHPFSKRAALQLARKSYSAEKGRLEFAGEFLIPQPKSDEDPHLLEQLLLNFDWKELPVSFAGGNPREVLIRQIPRDGEHEWYCSMLVIHAGDEIKDVMKTLFAVLRSGDGAGENKLQIGSQAVEFLTAAFGRRRDLVEIQEFLSVVFEGGSKSEDRNWQRAVLRGFLKSAPGARTWLMTSLSQLSAEGKLAYSACLNEVLFGFQDPTDAMEFSLTEFSLLSLLPQSDTLPVLKLIASGNDVELKNASIEILRLLPGTETVGTLDLLLKTGTPQIRRSVISALSVSTEGIEHLLNLVEAGDVALLEIDDASIARAKESPVEGQRSRAGLLLTKTLPADRVRVLEEYASVLTMEADPRRGIPVFERACATCHKVGDRGVNVAPDISDSRTKSADFLLVNILDPNRAIDNNFFSFTIVDADGITHSGIVVNETSTAVTLKQPEGKTVTIARSDIDEMKNNGVSLMPEGLERSISPQEMADLISYIKNWRYLDGQIPEEVIR
ncbi:PVC-type heme-binding CxxCH protein [Planctomicrobium sp. SH668]|uniref:PVC-type heme-binding CxxCH protein n=1 Tax=Planctomicrobium sp. SH668 TaxID=3448126 RepID=UPI003F5B7388